MDTLAEARDFVETLVGIVSEQEGVKVSLFFKSNLNHACYARMTTQIPDGVPLRSWADYKREAEKAFAQTTGGELHIGINPLLRVASGGFDRFEYAGAKHLVAQYPDVGEWSVFKLVIHEMAHIVDRVRNGIIWKGTVRRGRNAGKPIVSQHGKHWKVIYAELLAKYAPLMEA